MKKISAIVIGASTGGPKAIEEILSELPNDLDVPIFIVQHMPKGITKGFANRLNDKCKLNVVEAEDGMKIQNNYVYVAPGGQHMEIISKERIGLNMKPHVRGVRPSVDNLFISASKTYKNELLGIVLTGMGKDGTNGVLDIKSRGGTVLVESEDTSIIYGMPKSAYETGRIDEVMPLQDIAKGIVSYVKGER